MTITTRRSKVHLKKPPRPRDHDLDGPARETSARKAAVISGVKAIAPLLLALVPFAVAFGAAAKGSGLSTLEALAMSLFLCAGAAQLAMLPLMSAGASVAVIILTVFVINLRMTLYSASLAPHLRHLSAGWKAYFAYLLTDQAYAASIARFDEGRVAGRDKRWYLLGVTLPTWVVWLAGTALGAFLGSWASESWSLDFVLPLTFIALAVPAIKDRATGSAAIFAGATALFVANLPLNLGLISAALAGVLGGLLTELVISRRPG